MKKNINDDKKSFASKSYLLIKKNPIVTIGLLSFMIYFQTFFFGFVQLDDIPILQFNFEYFDDLSNIPDSFTRDAFVHDEGSFYRPIQTVSFILETNIAGGKPYIFHITNVILHIFTCIGIFLFFRKLKFKNNIPLLAGMLYAVHPLFTHAVSWVPARNDLLITFFCIYSFITFVDYINTGKLKYFLIHIILLFLALFSKETASVFPFICFLYIYLFSKPVMKSKEMATLSISWIFALVFWFVVRMSAIGLSWNDGDFGFIQLFQNSLVIPELISKMLVPFFFRQI